MTNDKDKAAIEQILNAHSLPVAFTSRRNADVNTKLRDALASLLTTTRLEAVRGAFKVLCPDCAEGDEPTLDQQARWYYHGELHETVGCSASKLRLAAAKEGSGE